MSLTITVDDLVIELPEEGDPVRDKPSMDDDASGEYHIRLVYEEAADDTLFFAGGTDPTKLAIQIVVLDNSGTPRSDDKGALTILNDAGTTAGIISQAGSLVLPVGSTASIEPTVAARGILLQVKRRRQKTICIQIKKAGPSEICVSRPVLEPIGKPVLLATGDATPGAGGDDKVTLTSNGSLKL
jgi:hypothetical protein